jgi:TonB family protein
VCSGVFPAQARSERGVVTVALRVSTNGRAVATRIVDERPAREGFGGAARHCLGRVRFQPALDASGQAVASTSVLRLRFARHPSPRRPLSAALSR